MEYINKVELSGVINNITVDTVGNTRQGRLRVGTIYFAPDAEGNPQAFELNRMDVTATESEDVRLEGLEIGSAVHLTGRIRTTEYVDRDGIRRYRCDIIAHTLEAVTLD